MTQSIIDEMENKYSLLRDQYDALSHAKSKLFREILIAKKKLKDELNRKPDISEYEEMLNDKVASIHPIALLKIAGLDNTRGDDYIYNDNIDNIIDYFDLALKETIILKLSGHNNSEVADLLGVCKQTISYRMRKFKYKLQHPVIHRKLGKYKD